MAEKDSKTLLREAYTAATQRLREAHREEFNGYYGEEAKQRGVEWSPRLSPEEKAKATLEALIAEHPDLLKDYVSG